MSFNLINKVYLYNYTVRMILNLSQAVCVKNLKLGPCINEINKLSITESILLIIESNS